MLHPPLMGKSQKSHILSVPSADEPIEVVAIQGFEPRTCGL